MPRENKTRYALLGMLTYQPMSGYDMKKMSDHSIGHFWNENFGSIYPVLKKLENEGLVTKSREDRTDGPSRNTYTITDKGRNEVVEWLARDPEPRILREELLLQVFFGQWAAPGTILEKLKKEMERCRLIIAELEGIEEHLVSKEELDSVPPKVRPMIEVGTPFWRHTVEYGLGYYASIRDWCSQTIKEMEKDQ